MGRIDHKIYDWSFHLEQERIEGTAVGRTRERKSVERRHAIAQGDNGDVILFRRSIRRICGTGPAPVVGMCHVCIRLWKAYGVALQLVVEHVLNILRVD